MTILEQILETKRAEVSAQQAQVPLGELKARCADTPPPRDFERALRHSPNPIALIAEVKRASPSKGVIRQDFDPVATALAYTRGGADAISVLTDASYFQGKLEYLQQVRNAVPLPLLRKDFIIDPYQIYQSRVAGADAILLIVASTPDPTLLQEWRALAESLGLTALVEVHDEAELDIALQSGAQVVGINNRNLKTFETTLETTFRLLPRIPSEVVCVSESGIENAEQVRRLCQAGVNALLVGESLMRAATPEATIREWMNACHTE